MSHQDRTDETYVGDVVHLQGQAPGLNSIQARWMHLLDVLKGRIADGSVALAHSTLVDGVFFFSQGYLVVTEGGRFGFSAVPEMGAVNWDALLTNQRLEEAASSLEDLISS